MGKGAKQVRKFTQAEQKKREMEEEQKRFDRSQSKKRLTAQIKNMGRDIIFKKGQLDTGIVETRTVHLTPDGSATIVDGYIDNMKPKHIIENEITEYGAKIEIFQEQIDEIKKIEEEENARETTAEGS